MTVPEQGLACAGGNKDDFLRVPPNTPAGSSLEQKRSLGAASTGDEDEPGRGRLEIEILPDDFQLLPTPDRSRSVKRDGARCPSLETTHTEGRTNF